LQKDDIDFEKGIIAVRPEINKTGKRDIVPIHFYIQSSIEHMREALNNPHTGRKPGETDPQLTHENRKVPSFFVFN